MIVNKKTLTTALVTFATLSGLSTLFAIPIVILNAAILTNPASALPGEPDGEGRGGINPDRSTNPGKSTPNSPSTNYYPPAIKFLLNNSSSIEQITTTVWNEGGKGIVEQKIKEALNGRKIREGINVYGANVSLTGISKTQTSPGSNNNQLNIKITIPGNNSEFKTTTPTVLGSYADPSFRVMFDLEENLKISASGNHIQVDDVSIRISNANIHGSNAIGTLVETFADLWTNGGFSQDIISRINGDFSAKGTLASFIQSAIDRYVPANVLVNPRILDRYTPRNIPIIVK